MKIESKVKKYQQGGPMPAEATAPAPAPAEGGNMAPTEPGADDMGSNPMEQILAAAQQAVQTQNCEAAMMVCQALLEIVAQAQGGPQSAPQEEPTFARNGAKIVRVR